MKVSMPATSEIFVGYRPLKQCFELFFDSRKTCRMAPPPAALDSLVLVLGLYVTIFASELFELDQRVRRLFRFGRAHSSLPSKVGADLALCEI